MEIFPLGFDAFTAERDDLAQHHSRDVGRLAQRRVAHNIKIRESGQTEGLADSVAARALDIEGNLGPRGNFVTEKKRIDLGRCILPYRAQAVGAAVFRRERRVPLQDDVRLTGDPVAAGLRVGEERQAAVRREKNCRSGRGILPRIVLVRERILRDREVGRPETQQQPENSLARVGSTSKRIASQDRFSAGIGI